MRGEGTRAVPLVVVLAKMKSPSPLDFNGQSAEHFARRADGTGLRYEDRRDILRASHITHHTYSCLVCNLVYCRRAIYWIETLHTNNILQQSSNKPVCKAMLRRREFSGSTCGLSNRARDRISRERGNNNRTRRRLHLLIGIETRKPNFRSQRLNWQLIGRSHDTFVSWFLYHIFIYMITHPYIYIQYCYIISFYTYICVCVCGYIYIHIYIYRHIYIYIHTMDTQKRCFSH